MESWVAGAEALRSGHVAVQPWVRLWSRHTWFYFVFLLQWNWEQQVMGKLRGNLWGQCGLRGSRSYKDSLGRCGSCRAWGGWDAGQQSVHTQNHGANWALGSRTNYTWADKKGKGPQEEGHPKGPRKKGGQDGEDRGSPNSVGHILPNAFSSTFEIYI